MQSIKWEKEALQGKVEQILELDGGVVFAAFSDKHGEIVFGSTSRLIPLEEKNTLNRIPSEKAFAPALIAAVVRQGEEYFGRARFVVASYEHLNIMFVPVPKYEVIALLGLTPESAPESISIKVEKLFN